MFFLCACAVVLQALYQLGILLYSVGVLAISRAATSVCGRRAASSGDLLRTVGEPDVGITNSFSSLNNAENVALN